MIALSLGFITYRWLLISAICFLLHYGSLMEEVFHQYVHAPATDVPNYLVFIGAVNSTVCNQWKQSLLSSQMLA